MTSEKDISAWLDLERQQIRSRLERAVAQWAETPERLSEAMKYSLLGGGKRLRPTLVLLANHLFRNHESTNNRTTNSEPVNNEPVNDNQAGQDNESAWLAATAIEMVHTYSLIHDDLPAMDNDDYRRGRLSCHKKFDEATAILAGDALLTGAFQILAQIRPADVACSCAQILSFAAGPAGMVGGQEDDVLFDKNREEYLRHENLSAFLDRIHQRKCGALIRAALLLGATTAEATEIQKNAIAEYGDAFGLAFQITDDLLDALGDEKSVGKRLSKDAEAGKLTFVTLWGIDESRRRASLEVERALAALHSCKIDNFAYEVLTRLVRQLPERTC